MIVKKHLHMYKRARELTQFLGSDGGHCLHRITLGETSQNVLEVVL